MENSLELFLHNIEEDTQDIIDWGDYRIGYFIQKNKTKGSENQDTLFIMAQDDFCIFGVADGAGGHPNGIEASYSVGESIFQHVRGTKSADVQLISLIESANTKVREKYPEAFTTLSFAALFSDDLRSYSVGDSEVQYYNNAGEIIYNNIPQSPVGYAVEAGMLSQEEGLDHNDRNIVNNLIGDEHLRIEVASKVTLKKGFTVIVGSDGLFDNISHETLHSHVGSGSFEEGFEKLCQLCSQRGDDWRKDDDVSFILLRKVRA
jgi:serine/threonine protein phosphatase PrpC